MYKMNVLQSVNHYNIYSFFLLVAHVAYIFFKLIYREIIKIYIYKNRPNNFNQCATCALLALTIENKHFFSVAHW